MPPAKKQSTIPWFLLGQQPKSSPVITINNLGRGISLTFLRWIHRAETKWNIQVTIMQQIWLVLPISLAVCLDLTCLSLMLFYCKDITIYEINGMITFDSSVICFLISVHKFCAIVLSMICKSIKTYLKLKHQHNTRPGRIIIGKPFIFVDTTCQFVIKLT